MDSRGVRFALQQEPDIVVFVGSKRAVPRPPQKGGPSLFWTRLEANRKRLDTQRRRFPDSAWYHILTHRKYSPPHYPIDRVYSGLGFIRVPSFFGSGHTRSEIPLLGTLWSRVCARGHPGFVSDKDQCDNVVGLIFGGLDLHPGRSWKSSLLGVKESDRLPDAPKKVEAKLLPFLDGLGGRSGSFESRKSRIAGSVRGAYLPNRKCNPPQHPIDNIFLCFGCARVPGIAVASRTAFASIHVPGHPGDFLSQARMGWCGVLYFQWAGFAFQPEPEIAVFGVSKWFSDPFRIVGAKSVAFLDWLGGRSGPLKHQRRRLPAPAGVQI